MNEAELIFTALTELATRQVAEKDNASGIKENSSAAKTGGNIAKRAKEDFENRTGQKVVTGDNFLPPQKQAKKLTKKKK